MIRLSGGFAPNSFNGTILSVLKTEQFLSEYIYKFTGALPPGLSMPAIADKSGSITTWYFDSTVSDVGSSNARILSSPKVLSQPSANNTFVITYTPPPTINRVEFRYRVQSENTYDFGKIYLNTPAITAGTVALRNDVTSLNAIATGTMSLFATTTRVGTLIPGQPNTITLQYYTDGSNLSGSANLLISQIRFFKA